MSTVGFYADAMLRGAVVTLELGGGGIAASLITGAALGYSRLHAPKPARAVIAGYVELLRGLPPILQLFVLFYGLSQFGVSLSAMWASLVWLVLYGAAYASEIFRAGFAGVHHGQGEAAAAIGLSRLTTLRVVLLPQAIARMVPALTNFLVMELKLTSIVYLIGVHDVMYQASLGATTTEQPLVIYAIAAGIYVVLNVTLSRLGDIASRRTAWAR